MEKYNFYKGQYPSQADFDNVQENTDDALKDFFLAHGYPGVVAGLVPTASAGAPTFDLIITAGTAYDKDGEHVYVSTNQTIDVSVDELGATTYTDLAAGEFRWVSIFLHFDRAQSDPHVDDDGVTQYFVQAESFTIRVVNGVKGAAPVTEPALDASDILLGDLYMYNGIADVVAADIHIHRREEIGYYRSSTGGMVKHKNDTMHGPDTDSIEETLDDDIPISQYKKYGDRYIEYRDRQHARNRTRLCEWDDDFFYEGTGVNPAALRNWWNVTTVGAPVVGYTSAFSWGVYDVQLRNANNDEWLLEGLVLTALEDGPMLEVCLMCTTAVDAEHGLYFGIENVAAAAHNHTEEGFGFYHANGNWMAVNHSGAAATTTDSGVAVSTTLFQRLRAHCMVDTTGAVTKILFYINDALVATHTTNLPATVGAVFQPFINYATIAGPCTSNKDLVLDRYFMAGIRRYNHE